jgi:hypothetical protein
MRLLFGQAGADYSELPYNLRAATLVGLIAVNVATWGFATAVALRIVRGRP